MRSQAWIGWNRAITDIFSGGLSAGYLTSGSNASIISSGFPSLWISEDEILALLAPFKFSLAFFGLDSKVFFNLKLAADCLVTLLDPILILIKLTNDMDYYRVFFHRSYFVLLLLISLRNPPLSLFEFHFLIYDHIFFSPCTLHRLGSLFHHPLQTNNKTSISSHPLIAQVLVELDITILTMCELGLKSLGIFKIL
ncbi:hypothetical protein IEQ34_015007 [Dendrobium chrysotoxum]|uniref:Uncharacterized protein n=1 Tax=Dendrobium chrysotoxum TaxID=161865 RepID=A0AAV7GNA9_DENCH|nr:hypothetical protein IEQ34_015007 [Dendrobium chrysotoxum]